MDMTGERRIPAPRNVVWNALNDPDVLKASIPGCQSLEKLSDTEMRATAAVKIGPISARFNGNVQLADLDPPNAYTISGEGQGGVAGFAKGGARVRLDEDGPGTLLRYEVNAQVGGKIAQLGARLIDATAKQLADQFFDRFSAQVAQPVVAEAAPPVTAAAIPEPAAGRPVFPAGPGSTQDQPAPPSPRVFPSAPSVEVAHQVLPPAHPRSAVGLSDLVPPDPFGLPVVAWVGIVIYALIVLLYIVSTL